jgi:type II secretory pathway pseudopilin PulG
MRGFTLIESIIYIGLFGIMCTGIFVSMYPLFTNAERLSKNILTESETVFILNKINYALSQGITSLESSITEPEEGMTSDTLTIENDAGEIFSFAVDTSNSFCSPPRVCNFITYAEGLKLALPLHNERIFIEHFSVTHIAPTAETSRRINVSFVANGILVGPITFFPHF